MGVGVAQQGLGAVEVAEQAQRAQGGQPQQPVPLAVLRQGLGRPDPEVVDGLDAVVTGDLALRGTGDEEAGIEPRGGPGGVTQWLR